MNTNLEVLFNCLYFQVIQYLISDPDLDPVYLIDEKNWRQFSDEMELRRLCMLELEKNPTAVRFHWINHRLKYQVSEWLNCSLNWKHFFIQTVICSAFYPIHINWAPGQILKIFLLPLYFTAFQGQGHSRRSNVLCTTPHPCTGSEPTWRSYLQQLYPSVVFLNPPSENVTNVLPNKNCHNMSQWFYKGNLTVYETYQTGFKIEGLGPIP